jgi:hypothetical protein
MLLRGMKNVCAPKVSSDECSHSDYFQPAQAMFSRQTRCMLVILDSPAATPGTMSLGRYARTEKHEDVEGAFGTFPLAVLRGLGRAFLA